MAQNSASEAEDISLAFVPSTRHVVRSNSQCNDLHIQNVLSWMARLAVCSVGVCMQSVVGGKRGIEPCDKIHSEARKRLGGNAHFVLSLADDSHVCAERCR